MSDLAERVRRLEDIEAIRTLDARYCRLLDARDWTVPVELFTPDGEFVGLSHARGRDALLAFFAGLADGGLTAFWHHVTNLEIEVAGDTARVQSLLWQPCVQDGVPHVAAGRYTDALVPTGSGWRYREGTAGDVLALLDGLGVERFHYAGCPSAGPSASSWRSTTATACSA